jgi:hypothetical protein
MAVTPVVDLVAEAQLNGVWTDISTDVYQRDDVVVTRGQPDESTAVRPTICTMTLDNRAGNYSTRNPMGAYYGSIGRNTPMRLAARRDLDEFNRTSSSNWSTSSNSSAGAHPSGNPWLFSGGGGSVVGTDCVVGSGVATHSVPAVAAFRLNVQTYAMVDGDVAVTWSCALASITGGNIEPGNLILNATPTTAAFYAMVRIVVAPGGAITISLMTNGGTVLAPAVTTGLTYAAGTKYRVRGQWEGRTYRARCWLASGAEPLTWQVVATDATKVAQVNGWPGVRSGIATANTNALPIVFTYDDWEVRSYRFYGEASNFPASMDVTGNDQYVRLEAAGITRRLGATGTPPLQSAMYRAAQTGVPAPVHYWPCEDGAGAAGASNITVPSAPLTVAVGATTWSTYTGFDCSKALPQFNKTDIWQAWTLGYAVTGTTQLRFLMHVPSGGTASGSSIMDLKTTGTIGMFRLIYDGSGGNLRLEGYDANNVLAFTSGSITFHVDDRRVRVDFQMVENGSGGVDWKIATLGVGESGGSYITGTVASQTVGAMYSLVVNSQQQLSSVAIGHVMLYTTAVDMFAQAAQLNAYAGETASARMVRLAGEEGIELYVTAGQYDDSGIPMGSQTPQTLLSLLQECAEVDMGYLVEARSFLGYLYRRRTDLYNQLATVTASYSGHEMQGDWSGPVSDDQITHNDITLTRQGGGSLRSTSSTGRMSTAAPPAGAGPYPGSDTVNVQVDGFLRDLGGWRLGQGTIDRERYSAVSLDRRNIHVQANAALLAGLTNADTGLKCVITGTSPIGLYDDGEQVITGYVEHLSRFVHTVALTTTPEELYHAPVFDDGISRWSPDTSTVGTGFNTVATSLSITSAAGTPLWTTSAGDFPFDVIIAGERMTVTNITGAASPQTFTVTRSVNGVVKSHLVGEQVSLFRPVYLAL